MLGDEAYFGSSFLITLSSWACVEMARTELSLRRTMIRPSLVQQWVERPAFLSVRGGGPRVVVSTAALHARVRGSVPGLGGLKETKLFLPIHV